MHRVLSCASALAALSILALAAAQSPRPTMEERVTALESALATLETRFGLQSAQPSDFGGESGLALAGRVTAIERSLERLAADVERVQRLADSAARDAAAAQRDATSAQQTAREAAMRAR